MTDEGTMFTAGLVLCSFEHYVIGALLIILALIITGRG